MLSELFQSGKFSQPCKSPVALFKRNLTDCEKCELVKQGDTYRLMLSLLLPAMTVCVGDRAFKK